MKSLFHCSTHICTIFAMLVMVACSSDGENDEPIRIGVIYPLTGGAASSGADLKASAELAAEIVNGEFTDIDIDIARNAGISSLDGRKLELIFRDHAGDPETGAQLARELINEEQVDLILGSYHSSVTETVSEVCEEEGVPHFNGTSTSPSLTTRGYKWFWRTTPHDKYFTKDLFEFLDGLVAGDVRGVNAVAKADVENIAYACENSAWGSNVAALIDTMADEYGYTVAQQVSYDKETDNVDTEVTQIVESGATVNLFASYANDAILMMQGLKAQGATPNIIWGMNSGFESEAFQTTLGDDIVGVLSRTVFLGKVTEVKKVAEQVNDRYKEVTGNDLNGNSARAFTLVQTVAHVLEKAGSTKPADIQNAANTLYIPPDQLVVPWSGIKFSSSGEELGQNILGTGLILQYQKPADDLVMEIVYPFDLATADMIYPFAAF